MSAKQRIRWSRSCFAVYLILCLSGNECVSVQYETNCSTLKLGQYLCPVADIDSSTQQPKGCTRNNTAHSNFICKYFTFKAVFSILDRIFLYFKLFVKRLTESFVWKQEMARFLKKSLAFGRTYNNCISYSK